MQKFLFGLLIFFAITGCTVLIITLIIYYRYSHILWFKDIDKDYFGVLGEFIGGVVGTLFSIITTILVYITYNSQQKDVIENKRLLQKQIDLSIKPDVFFTNSIFYGFSRVTDTGECYALDFSNNAKAMTEGINYYVSVDMVNIGVGVAKNIEFKWDFNLKEIQTYLQKNYENNPVIIEGIDNPFVELNINGIKDKIVLGQPYYQVKRRRDILLSHNDSASKFQIQFPLPYMILYFIAIRLSIKNRKNNLNSFMALDDFPICKLHLTYADISSEKHVKEFNFLFSGLGSFALKPKESEIMLSYEVFAHETESA
ncbi:hypothetical protein [Mucilaginibacter sp.]